jgi:hypothetical protein
MLQAPGVDHPAAKDPSSATGSTAGDREGPERFPMRAWRLVANRNTPRKVVWRAEIVLASAVGLGTMAIMRRTGTSKPTIEDYLDTHNLDPKPFVCGPQDRRRHPRQDRPRQRRP